MNLVKRVDQYDNNNIFFCEPTKNNVMNEGNFIRILYSKHTFALNGIYLLVTLHNVVCEKYYTKYRCSFNATTHYEIIQSLKTIEEDLLNKYDNDNKIPQYKIYEQLKNGNIKLFTDVGNSAVCSFVLKISGIWETECNYGLTYKFVKIN